MINSNHIQEKVQLATGQITQSAFARLAGMTEPEVSRQKAQLFASACNFLQGELQKAQDVESGLKGKLQELEERAGTLQLSERTLQIKFADLQDRLQRSQESEIKLQVESTTLQEKLQALQLENTKLQAFARTYTGETALMKFLASSKAWAAMLTLLAVFEIAGSFNILEAHTCAMVAVPVSIALGFALMVFTARNIFWAKVACVVFSALVGGVWLNVLPDVFFGTYPELGQWIFAIAPATISAILAFSKKTI